MLTSEDQTTITKPIFTGGCACGAIRYECTAEPEDIQMFRCHCRDCQRISGGPYAPVVFVPASTLRVTRGRLRYHTTVSELAPRDGDPAPRYRPLLDGELPVSGEHKRGFCPDCGARLTGGEGHGSTSIGVTASSLDDPGFFRAQFDIWTRDAQPWEVPDTTVPQFETLPPES